MKNLSVDLMSNIDTINYDQGLQIQRFNDTLNAIQLQIVSESELVKLLHKNISAVNQTALTIINDVKIHCDHEMIKLTNIITKLSSKVDNVRNDQVLQSKWLHDIDKDHDSIKLQVWRVVKSVELLQESINVVNEGLNAVKTYYDNEIVSMHSDQIVIKISCHKQLSTIIFKETL